LEGSFVLHFPDTVSVQYCYLVKWAVSQQAEAQNAPLSVVYKVMIAISSDLGL